MDTGVKQIFEKFSRVDEVADGVEDRFWDKVNKGQGNACWEWTGATNEKGYGVFSVDGETMGAHRFVLKIETGKCPSSKQASHTCHNNTCVNPDHLEWETDQENTDREN